MRKLLLTILLPLFLALTTYGQSRMDNLSGQMRLYAKKMQSPVLFVHFDKNVYSSNENVWFTAYLMNYTDAGLYHTLSMTLIHDADKAVVMQDRFLIGKGVCFGNTVVPDSIGPGNYTFIVTTNRLLNSKPEMVFSQPITIKTQNDPVFTASLNPLDTSASKAEQKVMLLVGVPVLNLNKRVPVPQIAFKYYAGNSYHPLLQGEGKTNGQYTFTVPSNLLVQGNNLLHVELTYKGETRDISMALPARPRPAIVSFFPEGGNLVNDIQSTVGLEVRTAAGAPLGASAFLYDNDKLTDTVQTNSYGLGKFTLTPRAGHSYNLRLYYVNKKDTTYQLPRALAAGPALSVNDAVVNDTLIVTIKDSKQEKLYLTGHNYQQLFFTQPVNTTAGVKRIKLVIKGLPKGLAELTLTDSLNRPFAERLFFAHYDKREPVKISTDKSEYATREKVNVKIKLDTSLPDSGMVSIACVQENRISINKKNDIESYFYLKHDLGGLPERESYLTAPDKQFLESILLIKGWSRYTWTDMLKTQPTDTTKKISYLSFTGKVTWVGDKPSNLSGVIRSKIPDKVTGQVSVVLSKTVWQGQPLKDPVNIVNLANPLNVTSTDKTGTFALRDSFAITEPGKLVTLIVPGKHPKGYKMAIKDPYASFNTELAISAIPDYHEIKANESNNYLEIPPDEHARHLKEVKINGYNDNEDILNYQSPSMGKNECGDYVCRYNVLNCPNHVNAIDNLTPIKGRYYLTAVGPVPYAGCILDKIIDRSNQFKGIYAAQEFYPSDYSKDTTGVNDYQSTIYWNYHVKVSSLKDAELSFPTSDITGRYKIVVQGVTGNDVTYGETTFNVVKGK